LPDKQAIIPAERIEHRILLVREHRVMLDADLAALYGVSTKRLNEQVKRNRRRFPEDFTFELTREECQSLRSQTATSNVGRGGRRTLPRAFTEHGAIMVASVLNTARATEVSVYVVRAFVKLREIMGTQKEIARKLTELEETVETHDESIQALFEAIRRLMAIPKKRRPRIGFRAEIKK
jgi:hypothetical protein